MVVRGLYDVAGLRADADFMIWTHAERLEALQADLLVIFRSTTTLGRATHRGGPGAALAWTAPRESPRATSRRSWPARGPPRRHPAHRVVDRRGPATALPDEGAPRDAGRARHGRPRL